MSAPAPAGNVHQDGWLQAAPAPGTPGDGSTSEVAKPPLLSQHREQLKASGICPQVLAERGYRSIVSQDDLAALGFNRQQRRRPALLVPLYNVAGKSAGCQARPDQPRLDKDGKPVKYETPTGQPLVVDVHPRIREKVDDPMIPLFITEGVKKADAAISCGLCCVSITGVWCWRGTNRKGGRVALPDWDQIALNGRRVYLVFDSDVTIKREVHRALRRLKAFLEARGAEVWVVYLPPGPGGQKTGLDDYLAAGHTPQDLLALAAPELRPAPEAEPDSSAERVSGTEKFSCSDSGNAERLIARHGRDLRYCPAWKTWLIWDGRRWTRDETGEVVRRAQETVRSIYREASAATNEDQRRELARHALASESERHINAMIGLARFALDVSVTTDALDTDPWSLNALNGTIDLRTGALREHRREDLFTKLVPCDYDPAATCHTFDAFLNRILAGNTSLKIYVQRLAGYSASGSAREKVLAIPWGSGDNGKSTLLETLGAVLGDYGESTPPETLLTRDRNAVRDDLARLKGARFVWTGENERGRKLAVATIKAMTGRDRITARFLYEKLFSYIPEYTVWFATNHRPEVPDSGDAIWNRIKLIPFTVSIPKKEQDKELPEKLLREAAGILAWIVRGCLEWQREGLGEPNEVTQATQQYRAEMDPVADFLTDCCVVSEKAWVKNPSLWKAYEDWCAANGERRPLNRNEFADELQQRSFKQKVTNGKKVGGKTTRIWLGLGLIDDCPDDSSPDTGPEERPELHPEGFGYPPGYSVSGTVTAGYEDFQTFFQDAPYKGLLEKPVTGCNRCNQPESLAPAAAVSPPTPESESAAALAADPPSGFTYITADADLLPAIEAVAGAEVVALDLETTGLNPRQDRIRLLSVAAASHVYLIDCFRVDPAPLLAILPAKEVVAHNAAFDLGFLAALGFEVGAAHDTMLLSMVLHAGTREDSGARLLHSLAAVVARELEETLTKEEQQSDWSGELTAAQLEYAARDVAALLSLHDKLRGQITAAGLEPVVDIERRCLPALVWMSAVGVPFDAAAWQALTVEVETEVARLRGELNAAAPKPPGLDLGQTWNWDSPAIVARVLREMGLEVNSTDDETLAGLDHPLAALLRQYREVSKLARAYGRTWLEAVESGRLYPGWWQLGAASGRMACQKPNVQQIPRDPRYRACIAAPAGWVLVKADYSQIELRIAAKIANEKRMLEAYRQGQDLHRLTASLLLGKPVQKISKADRQLAKAVNFGLIYGMGAEGFRVYAQAQYGVEMTPDEAQHYRDAFFTAYPGLLRWHRKVRGAKEPETRTLAGRRRLLDEQTPFTQRLNTPVQGTGADGLKRALALLWERRGECPGAVPVIACHDEIVVECDASHAEAVAAWLKQAMLDGMQALIHPVPVEVELVLGRTWAEKE